jgi:hemoglobin-like flavoprotein
MIRSFANAASRSSVHPELVGAGGSARFQERDPVVDIQQSLRRILESEDIFGKLFYDTFFARYPEAAKYFANTDMERQALVLTMALTLIVQYHLSAFSSVGQYLKHLGTRHHALNVPPEIYPKWRDAMIAALERFHDTEWSDELADEWQRAIEASTKPMLRGYDDHAGV